MGNDIPFQAMEWHDPPFLAAVSSDKPQCVLSSGQEGGWRFPRALFATVSY